MAPTFFHHEIFQRNYKKNNSIGKLPLYNTIHLYHAVIFLLIIFSLGCKVLFQGVPGCNGIADLSGKIVFWTHKFAVGPIDMENSESQDP